MLLQVYSWAAETNMRNVTRCRFMLTCNVEPFQAGHWTKFGLHLHVLSVFAPCLRLRQTERDLSLFINLDCAVAYDREAKWISEMATFTLNNGVRMPSVGLGTWLVGLNYILSW